ncbi:MAG: saccharopine dehydrogenase NADP-binding domain-containing protein [Acidobacteriota bacterium]|nr:saccharopine dehydrogenase NADP-binding domain-containing protein [Acidobacteriota bacterium]
MSSNDAATAAGEGRLDLALFGATGFTGALTAEYLARRAAAGESLGPGQEGPLRWAIAGRNRDKLEALRRRLEEEVPGSPLPEILVASVDDADSLRALTGACRVLLTTVGPYARFGEGVVAACVETGTHYADITGEPDFVSTLRDRYDAAAREKGLRLVSCCGFDSIPHDLGALLAVRQLPADQKIDLRGFVRAKGGMSGGTWRSAVNAMAETPIFGKKSGKKKRARERSPAPSEGERRVRRGSQKVYREKLFGEWVMPLPTIDPQVVRRSARELPDYGPDFRYGHFLRIGSLPRMAVVSGTIGSVFALSKLPPARKWLLSLKDSGDGPTEEQRARSRFSVTFLGRAGDGSRTVVEVRGGDPGYDETSKMLAETGLSLAFDGDRLPQQAGTLTPAVALGGCLLERLREAGLVFEVVETKGPGEDA